MKEAMTKENITMLLFLMVLSFLSIRFLMKNYKNYKKAVHRMKELKDQKCKGPHDWLWMEMAGENINVCKDCCWSPTHEGYVMRQSVDAHIAQQKFQKELDEFTIKKLKELDVSEELYDKLINIKKDFTIKHLEQVMKDMIGGE